MTAYLRTLMIAGAIIAPATASAAIIFSASAEGTRVVTVDRTTDTPVVNEYGLNETRTDNFNSGTAVGRSTLSNVTIAEPSGDFFFKHDVLTFGQAEVNVSSVVTITITNTDLTASSTAQEFRSQIIPGHVGLVQSASNPGGGLAFALFEVKLDGARVYNAFANVSARTAGNQVLVSDTFRAFNGFRQYDDGAFITALDWSTTDLFIDLGVFAPGQVKTLTYETATIGQGFLFTPDACPTFEVCPAAQISFGDPRRNGTTSRTTAGARPAFDPVIGMEIGTFATRFDVVDATTPRPAPPTPIPPANYEPTAIPEPAPAALLGFGLAALALRRRR